MNTPSRVSLYDREAIERLRKLFRLDPALIREYRNSVCKKFRESDFDSQLSGFSEQVQVHVLELYRRCDSQVDGATKLLFRNLQGLLLETVILRIATGRTSLCISSQVGCAAACEFCATGRMGVARNLSAHEILDQFLSASQLLMAEKRRVRNIVFMGMGEPFHNEAEVSLSIELLSSPQYFNVSPNRILVSSVGVADAMVRCAERFPQVNQAISLHSVKQEVREQLIPLAKKYPLDQLRSQLVRINQLQACPLMVEYLMLDGVNDSQDDARQLANWLGGMNVHVNLIPFNPIDAAQELKCSERMKPFSEFLKASGLRVTTRYSLGSDIAAACGQLVQTENRRIAQGLQRNSASAG